MASSGLALPLSPSTVTMLSRAFAAGVQEQPPARSKSSANSILFSADFPFPCLLNPEEEEEDGTAELQTDDTAGGRDQEDDDVFDGWDGLDGDISSLRVASNTQRYAAAGPGQSRLVGADVCWPAWHRGLGAIALKAVARSWSVGGCDILHETRFMRHHDNTHDCFALLSGVLRIYQD